MSAYYRCTLKTQEFRTKDFFVRSTHSIERVGRQIFSGKLTAKQEFIGVIRLGMALTKTFLHIPLMGANPIGFK